VLVAVETRVRQNEDYKMNSVFELGGKAVNKNTAMAMSGGTNYEPNYTNNEDLVVFKVKPLLPKIENKQISDLSKELVGKRFSRLVVVGWFKKGGKWLCRCDCGYYTVRKTSTIMKALETQLYFIACQECMYVVDKKRTDYWNKTGKDLPREYFA